MTILAPSPSPADHRRIQRRTLAVLAATQVLGGAGLSTAAAVGGLAAAQLSGSAGIGGLALTASALGAALAGLPLARVAERSGRRAGLGRGYLIATVGAAGAAAACAAGTWLPLIAASLLLGTATTTTLAARFAATDLAPPHRRGRALAVVLWATTAGAVAGPNLAGPADDAAAAAGIAPAAGAYVLCAALFGAAALGVAAGLRPDPLLLAAGSGARALLAPLLPPVGDRARRGAAPPGPLLPAAGDGVRNTPVPSVPLLPIAAVVVAQAVMVALMSMAPVHLAHGGADLHVVGLAISVHVGAMYAFSPLFGWLADRVSRSAVVAAGSALLVAGALVAAASPPHAVGSLTAGLAVIGIGWSAVLVGASALLVDAVPVADRPRLQGAADTVMNVGGAAGGALAGAVVAAAGYAALGIGAAVLSAAVAAVVGRRAGQPRS